MGVPYSFIRVLERKEPYLKAAGKNSEEKARYLMADGHMKGLYLGECLDCWRWGSQSSIAYPVSVEFLIGFIKDWMGQNPKNFRDLYHERRIEELYKKFELPEIEHDKCPRDEKHKGRFTDLGGRVRCAHKSNAKVIKPSFTAEYRAYDALSETEKIAYCEHPPITSFSREDLDEKEYKKYLKEVEAYQNEEPETVGDVCGAILSERAVAFSLEKVLRREMINKKGTRNVFCTDELWDGLCKRRDEVEKSEWDLDDGKCKGHDAPFLEFGMDGWSIAFLVQRWHEQFKDGKKLLYFEKDKRV